MSTIAAMREKLDRMIESGKRQQAIIDDLKASTDAMIKELEEPLPEID